MSENPTIIYNAMTMSDMSRKCFTDILSEGHVLVKHKHMPERCFITNISTNQYKITNFSPLNEIKASVVEHFNRTVEAGM